MRKILYIVIALSLIPSCRSEERAELVFGVMSSMDYLPVAVAQKMEYFEKRGVSVKIEKFYSANDRDAAFQSGAIDGTIIDYTGALLQWAGGVELKITSACDGTFCIMSSPASGIESVQDLKGKRLSVSRNTVIDFCIDMALLSAGMKFSDVTKQEINKIPVRYEMLISGQSDATALPDPFVTIAKENGAKLLLDMNDLGYSVTGIMFREESLAAKDEMVKRFYSAYNDAVNYLGSAIPFDIIDILTKDIGFPENLVTGITLPNYSKAAAPSEKDMNDTYMWLRSRELIKEEFDPADLLDLRYISE